MTSQKSFLTTIPLTRCGAGAKKIEYHGNFLHICSIRLFEIMSLAYPVKQIRINTVKGLEVHEIHVGSIWKTGNLLFRASEPGSLFQTKTDKWAHGVDAEGRGYILWKAHNLRASRLVIQQLNSHYCFEVSPV